MLHHSSRTEERLVAFPLSERAAFRRTGRHLRGSSLHEASDAQGALISLERNGRETRQLADTEKGGRNLNNGPASRMCRIHYSKKNPFSLPRRCMSETHMSFSCLGTMETPPSVFSKVFCGKDRLPPDCLSLAFSLAPSRLSSSLRESPFFVWEIGSRRERARTLSRFLFSRRYTRKDRSAPSVKSRKRENTRVEKRERPSRASGPKTPARRSFRAREGRWRDLPQKRNSLA